MFRGLEVDRTRRLKESCDVQRALKALQILARDKVSGAKKQGAQTEKNHVTIANPRRGV